MTIQPTLVRPHPVGSGTQRIYRFDNNYGASVVRFEIMPGVGSHGAESGRWELAVLRFDGNTEGVNVGQGSHNWDLTYNTPITEDVLGHLDDDEVEELLTRIRDLDNPDVIRVEATLGEQPAIEGAEAVR